MFPVFLKDVAEWRVLRGNFNVWETDPTNANSRGIKTAFTNHFLIYTRKIKWNDQFDKCSQGKKDIEEHNDEYLHLWKKVDPTETYPAEMIIRKYVQSLRKDVGAHYYTHNLASLA